MKRESKADEHKAIGRINRIYSLLAVLIFAGCAADSPVERREHVTSYASAQSDLHQNVDIAPQPVGGMAAFVSRLYPPDLRRRHVVGVMRVRVSLDAAGHVLSAQVVKPLDPKFDAIVLRAVRHTQWRPAMRAGKPVPTTFRFPITFSV